MECVLVSKGVGILIVLTLARRKRDCFLPRYILFLQIYISGGKDCKTFGIFLSPYRALCDQQTFDSITENGNKFGKPHVNGVIYDLNQPVKGRSTFTILY